jgi:glycosyltransferase involved in cell wall biosynthesis
MGLSIFHCRGITIEKNVRSRSAVVIRSTDLRTDTRLQRIVHDLVSIEIAVHVLAWDRGSARGIPPSNEAYQSRVPVRVNFFNRRTPHGQGLANLRAVQSWQRWAYRRMVALRPDLIYACDLDSGVPGHLAAKRLGVPLVLDQFDPYNVRFPSRPLALSVSAFERYLMKRADVCVVADESRATGLPNEVIVGNLPLGHVAVSPVGRRPRTLVFGGNLLPDRGLSAAVEAVSRMSGWKFVILGGGPLADWASAEAARRPEMVEFHGSVAPDRILKAFASASAVLATYDPAIANNRRSAMSKVGECAVTASPLIVSRDTNASDLVAKYGVGATVDYGDVRQLMAVLPDLMAPARVNAIEEGWRCYLAENDQGAQHASLRTMVLQAMRYQGDRYA